MSGCGEINSIHRCEYARTITANGGWSFWGCTHEPYRGKWIAEINECPYGKTPEQERERFRERLKEELPI